jgi:hypothetical protein
MVGDHMAKIRQDCGEHSIAPRKYSMSQVHNFLFWRTIRLASRSSSCAAAGEPKHRYRHRAL